jgi:hypothetical protein
MPRTAKTQPLVQSRANQRNLSEVDAFDENMDADFDRDEFIALISSQGSSHVTLSSDDLAFQ